MTLRQQIVIRQLELRILLLGRLVLSAVEGLDVSERRALATVHSLLFARILNVSLFAAAVLVVARLDNRVRDLLMATVHVSKLA